jgi:hypothetical protein
MIIDHRRATLLCKAVPVRGGLRPDLSPQRLHSPAAASRGAPFPARRHPQSKDSSSMASSDPLHITFDDGFGSLGAAWQVDTSTPGEVRRGGLSALME